MGDNKNDQQDGDRWLEPRFDAFEEEEFEDSDRDSDFAAFYTEEDDPEADTESDAPPSSQARWDFADDDDQNDETELVRDTAGEEDPVDWELDDHDNQQEPDDWLDDNDELEEVSEPSPHREFSLSFGMIAIAATAIILLGIGGYGVIEQRAALREEVRQLQAQLATSAPPSEVSASRAAAEEASVQNQALRAEVEELSQENRSLQAIVNGLEAQLEAQQKAQQGQTQQKVVATAPVTNHTPAKPAATTAAATPPSGEGWFVNFSSYTQRATAEKWQDKLAPSKGRVIVATGESGGRTVYRVRVIDLADKTTATTIARELEKQYDLQRLWVGQQ